VLNRLFLAFGRLALHVPSILCILSWPGIVLGVDQLRPVAAVELFEVVLGFAAGDSLLLDEHAGDCSLLLVRGGRGQIGLVG
jgi:hypothetical protein